MIIADDFGLSADHDKVILNLLNKGAIDGTSVMVHADLDVGLIEELKALRTNKKIEVGLHLNLTETLPDIPKRGSILSLWIGTIFGRIDLEQVCSDFQHQFDLFHSYFGFVPDYLDGHQHCHGISAFWPALASLCDQLEPEAWVRSPAANHISNIITEIKRGGPKTALVMWWGYHLRKRLKKRKTPTNSDFSGFIPYKDGQSFEPIFQDMLKTQRSNCVTMVHPGALQADNAVDGHDNALRAIEADVLLAHAKHN